MYWKSLCWLAALPLLVGCSAVRNPERLADSVQQGYGTAKTIRAEAVIHASNENAIQEYRVQVQYDNAQNPYAEITVQEPESIAGITAVYDAEENRLIYEDVSLQTILPEQDGLTPVDAVPAALHCLIAEEPTEIWREEDDVILQYEKEEDVGNVVRELALRAEDGALQYAAVSLNGKQRLRCEFDNCTVYQ